MRTRAITMTILAALLAASCASYRTRTESVPVLPRNAQAMSDQSVAVLPTTLLSSVELVPAGSTGGAALVFASDISISSEVLQVIEPGSSISPDDKPVAAGDYFLSLFGSCRFSLRDSAAGARRRPGPDRADSRLGYSKRCSMSRKRTESSAPDEKTRLCLTCPASRSSSS
jgi:hypothetical protein